jgi:hypothetical protein
MRRTLVLDEDDLIMVVKEDIVKQIDEHRGEMNRTEFVNYLIQCQLREHTNQKECVSREEFHRFSSEMTLVLHNFLEFFISYGMAISSSKNGQDIQALNQQLDSIRQPGKEIE